jgi:hypothetical protein
MMTSSMMRGAVALGRIRAGGGFRALGGGVLLQGGPLAWLLVPRELLEGALLEAPAGEEEGALVVVVLSPDDERIAIPLTDVLRAGRMDWVQLGEANPFALCPMPLPPSLGIRAVPEAAWRRPVAMRLGAPCWTVHVAAGVSGDFGPLVLDGSICAVQRREGRDALTTVPALPGGLGAPIFVRDPAPDAGPVAPDAGQVVGGLDGWRLAGCVTRRMRVASGRRQSGGARLDGADHFGVVASVEHVLPLFTAAAERRPAGGARGSGVAS